MSGRHAEHNFNYMPSNSSAQKLGVNKGRAPSIIGTASNVQGYAGIFFKYSFYATILVLFGFVFLIVLNTLGFKTFSFLPDDGGIIQVPLLPTNRQVLFPNTTIAADEPATFSYLVSSNYTISLDVYIQSDFVDQSAPRVLLYRGASNVVLEASDTTATAISNKMSQSNFILYLDPYTNDLMADVYISSTASFTGPSGSPSGPSGGTVRRISMPRIENVPIKTPFRVTMMLSDALLEVYIDGDLQKSVPLVGGGPRTITTASLFYGPPAMSQQSVRVSNLSYWNTPLSSKSIRTYGKESLNSKVFTD